MQTKVTLKQQVLDEFAKDKGHANWIELLDDWKSAFDHNYVPVDISDVVELALSAKQAEVEEVVDKRITAYEAGLALVENNIKYHKRLGKLKTKECLENKQVKKEIKAILFVLRELKGSLKKRLLAKAEEKE